MGLGMPTARPGMPATGLGVPVCVGVPVGLATGLEMPMGWDAWVPMGRGMPIIGPAMGCLLGLGTPMGDAYGPWLAEMRRVRAFSSVG